ncbi:MAG: hypothetical protein EPO08_07155 [Rhodospirillaceae bacterium]|nr:MAG: hypothetical protein EPO08_07155 [Rhodospirillaceae bacterium]
MAEPIPEQPTGTLRVWDLPTRLFHWALVVLVLMSFVTAEGAWPDVPLPAGMPGGAHLLPHMTLHIWCGYCILVLLLFRIGWGVVGSSTSRFADFVRGPAAILDYVRGFMRRPFLRGPGAFYTGHNPLGAVMVIVLLAALLAQAVTGLFAKDEDDFFGIAVGPLHGSVSDAMGKTLTHIHHLGHEAIEDLVYLHILANLFYWLVRRENLIGAMITGRRRLQPGQSAPPISFASGKSAVGLFALAVIVVWTALALLRR